MNSAFRQFMTGLVDYAGLFPPAGLEMAPAVGNYARYRKQNDSWMLGRFICPASRLGELADCLPADFAADRSWELSVLVGDGRDPAAALGSLATQGRAVATLENLFPGGIRAEALETPIPVGALPELGAFLTDLSQGLVAAGLGGRELYLELPPAGDWVTDAAALQGIADLKAARTGEFSLVAAKFRCGGITPEAFPTVERLAGVLAGCRQRGLPLKCTAGLHHPVRRRVSEPQVMMHGFLNVFGAGLLAHATAADEDTLTACLAETDPRAFVFTEEGFAWRDHAVSAPRIREIRRQLLCGFGSCSFDEPRDDLRELGIPDSNERTTETNDDSR